MHDGGGGFYHDGGGHDAVAYGHDLVGVPWHDSAGLNGDHGGGHHHGDHFDATSYANAFSGSGHTSHHHGGFLAKLLGLDQGQHHGLLAQLLGLDTKHHYAHQTPPEVTQQGQFLWENLGRVFRHDLFNEFELTPGKLFFFLLVGMIGWLFVLYFTRHHEPQVNALLGANVAQVAAYENSDRLNQPNQRPIELPSSSIYSFYTAPDKFYLSRTIAKQNGGFVALTLPQQSPAVPVPALGTGVSNQYNGTSSVKTADGRIQTIVNR